MKIICVGRNYAEHAAELGNAVPENPILFMKPATALLKDNRPFYHPEFSQDIHHEIELVFRISKNGKSIAPQFAHKYYDAVTLGIDFTARDLQQNCKTKGLPWEIAKAFDNSAVLGEWIDIAKAKAENPNFGFQMTKNQQVVQQGDAGQMIHNIDNLIAYISQFFTLQTGDLIYTGTPKGVSKISIGDTYEGFFANQKLFSCEIK